MLTAGETRASKLPTAMSTAIFSKVAETSAQRKGMLYTALALAIVFLCFQIWKAKPIHFPGMAQKQFEVTAEFDFTGELGSGGMMDFGNNKMGSGDVDNFEDPSPTPGDAPATNTNEAAVVDPVKESWMTSTDPTGVTANPGDKEVRNPDPNSQFNAGGSNHGIGDDVANWGRPDHHQLNDNGSFVWGTGGTGLGGRKWISLPDPEYKVNDETKITFEFVIAPSGDVVSVSRPISGSQELVRAGMEAIKKWKFQPVDPDSPNQKVKVTIIFRMQ
jgi:TonB family protein